VQDGVIRYVGPRSDAPTGEERDLGDVLLLPGLVNAHTHLELTVMRGFLEDLEFRRWILRLTSAKRSVLTQEMLLDSARFGVREGLAAGITTYADTCDSGAAFDAMLEYGVRGIVYQEVFGPDPAVRDEAMAGLERRVGAMRARENDLVRVGISPHAPYTVSDDLFRAAAAFARAERLPMAIHIAESEMESRLVERGDGPFADGLRGRGIDVSPRAGSPVRLLAQLGVLDLRPLLIHCIRVDDEDIATIARLKSPVVHCPVSNAKLGHGIAPVPEMLAAGVILGLGSDSMASNNRMDVLEEARYAILAQRLRLRHHEVLTAHDALELATVGGATVLGLNDRIGSLDAGKDADLIVVDGDPADPRSAVERVYIEGQLVYQSANLGTGGRRW
jgi:5-methylthioadenosine/S-adenosylhomocysteine deaminase